MKIRVLAVVAALGLAGTVAFAQDVKVDFDKDADFSKVKTQVIGVSKDSVEKHDKFKKKYGLTFPLVSDEDGKICEKYGTWVEKSLYGRKYMGIERATFLIDKTGTVAKVWHKVKVPGHVDEVLKALKAL